MIQRNTAGMREIKKEKTGMGQIEVCLPASELAEILKLPPHSISSIRLSKIIKEFSNGFSFLKTYGKTATFFGSSRFKENNPHYQEAKKLGALLSKDGFAVVTGGGPGIMEAANRGAYEAGGRSGGLNIQLPDGQRANKFVTETESFHYFFVRKVMLSFASEVYIFFPGGFGTLDEFFEIITLVQTKKIESIPVVLVGKDYWEPLLKWIEEELYQKYAAIDEKHMDLYYLAENAQNAFDYIHKTVREDRKQGD